MLLGLFENVMAALGLGGPLSRGVFGAVGGFGFQMLFKPEMSYVYSGTDSYTRPFALTSSDPNATYFPWWMWVIGPAALLALFI